MLDITNPDLRMTKDLAARSEVFFVEKSPGFGKKYLKKFARCKLEVLIGVVSTQTLGLGDSYQSLVRRHERQ